MAKNLKLGYHASHEQAPPSELLKYAIAAEKAGFDCAMCSDHLFPWSEQQAHSGCAWPWLGAALQATAKLPFGVVNAPGYRYHPVIIAHAAATLAEMHPGRFWIAVGSGEALNEHVTGEAWPPKQERNERLKECVDVMRALWGGEMVTHRGHVTVVEAKLYSLPKEPPRVVGAAITPETAEWMGGWADAMITASQPKEDLQKVIEAFRRGGGDGKPILLQQKVSFADSYDTALRLAHKEWRTNIFKSGPLADLRLPAHFEAIAQFVKPEDVAQHVRVSSDVQQHIDWILQDVELGFDEIYLHNVNLLDLEFIEAFGERVLPAVRKQTGTKGSAAGA